MLHRLYHGLKTFRNARTGFSIIELTIILAILSFIVVNALIVRNMGEEIGKSSDVTDQLERLQQALTRHVREFGIAKVSI